MCSLKFASHLIIIVVIIFNFDFNSILNEQKIINFFHLFFVINAITKFTVVCENNTFQRLRINDFLIEFYLNVRPILNETYETN